MNWFLFVAKKIIATLFYPIGTTLLFWLMGLLLLIRRPKSWAGVAMILTGGLWLCVSAAPITAFTLISSLEKDAGPYADPAELARSGVKFVVVLGGDVRGGDLTATDRVSCSSLTRLMEGIRLWKAIPGAKLALSGGTYSEEIMTCAEAMATLARELGVPDQAMILESKSWDTKDEARLLKPVLGNDRFALVTSASHMMRSLMCFRMEGLRPVPAPADFEAKTMRPDFGMFLPGTRSLDMTRKAIHEYLGMVALLGRAWVTPASVTPDAVPH